jgi:hypothetical protein
MAMTENGDGVQLYVFPMPVDDGSTWAWVEMWQGSTVSYGPSPFRDVEEAYGVIVALPVNAGAVVDIVPAEFADWRSMVDGARRSMSR